jgi:NAD(P)-dependent dehydrogenase (short-subunit alcohol dehydrogenase family)
MTELNGLTFFVSGAGSGIGKALAIELDKLGVHLVLNDINPQSLNDTADLLSQSPLCLPFSVADESAWQGCYSQIQAHYDKLDNQDFTGIDGIINNAGIAHDALDVDAFKMSDFNTVMDINFYGVVYATKTFLPQLKSKPKAWVVNVSSVFGIAGIAEQSAYCSAKFAVKGFTESLRMEAKANFPNVTITTIHPGGINTPIADSAIAISDKPKEQRDKQIKQFNSMLRTSPTKAAQDIIKGIVSHKHRVLIGKDASLLDFVVRVLPVKYTSIILKFMKSRGVIS